RHLGCGVVTDRLVVDRVDLELGPVGLRHGQPVAIGLQPPLGHPLGLVLDRGNGADRALVQPRRQAGHLDPGDEAGRVGAAEYLGHVGVVAQGGCAAAFADHAVHSVMASPVFTVTAIFRLDGTGLSMSAKVIPRRVWSSTLLMRCQLPRTPHCDSRSHWPSATLHSVMPIGPSSASTISASEIAPAGRASREPALTPRKDSTSSA